MKPATELAGFFAMSLVANLLTPKHLAKERNSPRYLVRAAQLASALLFLQSMPAEAGSAAAQFQVSVRVIKSCKVSTDSLAAQLASARAAITVNCGDGTAPANSTSTGSRVGSGLPSSSAIVNYSVAEVTGTDGDLKMITVNF